MWNVIQCAVQGRGHIKTDIPCQDKTYALGFDCTNVIALADGAGSARMSHIGAEFVTKYICESLTKDFEIYFFEEDGAALKRKIINDLQKGLEEIAVELNCDIKELASTLLVAAVRNGRYILLHIGDGVIGYLRDDEIKVASRPENGEFVNTTVFVTSPDVLQTMKLIKGNLGTISGFALMSDGTEMSMYSKKDGRLAPVLKKFMMFSRIMDVDCLETEIVKSFQEVIRMRTMDDCSLALLVEEDYSFQGYNKLSLKEKAELLGYDKNKLSKKRCRRFDDILNFFIVPGNPAEIARSLHLKKKYIIKYLRFLCSRSLLVKHNDLYQTLIIMDKACK